MFIQYMTKNKTLLCISYSCPPPPTFRALHTEEFPQRDAIMSELGTCVVYVLSNLEIVYIDSFCYTPMWRNKNIYHIVVIKSILHGFNRQSTVQASVDCSITKYSCVMHGLSLLTKLQHAVRRYDKCPCSERKMKKCIYTCSWT